MPDIACFRKQSRALTLLTEFHRWNIVEGRPGLPEWL